MYRLKGFATIRSLANNVKNVVASVGEISPYSMSFSKDVKIYPSANSEVTVLGFSSKTDETGEVNLPSVIQDSAIGIADWVTLRQKGLIAAESKAEFLNALDNEFGSIFSNISCGEMAVASNLKSYPEYISWKTNAYSADDNLNTIWFSDQAFRTQYDEYEIVVIPPIPTIDLFFSAYSEVTSAISAITWIDYMNRVQTVRGDLPETILTAESYNYVNPLNPSIKTATSWSFLVYGAKGNDPDALKAALLSYISTNSTRDIKLWKTIFPDIFRSTEFMIIPQWNRFSIPEMSIQTGIYSPIGNVSELLAYVKKVVPAYPPVHVETRTEVMSFPYKCLLICTIGNVENRDGLYSLAMIYKDILSVSSTSLDFNRMEAQTKLFLEILADTMYRAETATPYTSLPVNLKGVTRDNVFYLSFTFANVRYFVATKYGVNGL